MLAEGEDEALLDHGFDALYGWKLHHLLNGVAKQEKLLEEVDRYFHDEQAKTQSKGKRMYFTSNHDENSWNGTEYERMGDAVLPMAVLCATVPGIPLVYNGQELALKKRLEFFEKDPINWQKYELSPFYTTLLQLKRNHPALWSGNEAGSFTRINTSQDDAIFAYRRQKGTDEIIILLNLTPKNLPITLLRPIDINGKYKDAFTGKVQTVASNTTYLLSPWSYTVWVKE